jgi:acyl-CoA synthetase (AMP-forming)/AMP-acid ligase II
MAARLKSALERRQTLEAQYEGMTVGQLVSQGARVHGPKVAIDVFERGERATYAELEVLSNRYAKRLRAFGVRKGDRVGIILPNRIEFPILWFALANLGAVLVPINVRYSPREIEYVLNDTEANFAIVDDSVAAIFSAMHPWPNALAADRVIVVGATSSAYRGGVGFSDRGISGILAGPNRRNEVHEEAPT